MSLPESNTLHRALWDAFGRGLAAHAIMLRDTAISDDAIAASLLTAIDGVRRGSAPDGSGSIELVAAFDDRVDSLIAPGAVGAVRIGRARHDLAAAAGRLVLRDQALTLVAALDVTRATLLDIAASHVFTLMPVWTASVPLGTTNFAHFLTGIMAPLARAARRLQAAYDDLDHSPMGAGALAGPGLPIDRDELSDLLGNEGPVESTFDAVAASDHLPALAFAAAATVTPISRIVEEFLVWRRADPQALRVDDTLLAPADPNLPHFQPPTGLVDMMSAACQVEDDAASVASMTRAIPYGPAGGSLDGPVALTHGVLHRATTLHTVFASFIGGSLEINRAWLARNAGHALVTSGDLADLLMAEEGLDPSSARNIAAQVASKAQAEGLEASAITPEMIDAAALLTIGRELGIEIERLGAYLAPRRFIEKRTVLGGPAPPAIREYLGMERTRLAEDSRWLEGKRRRITQAEENLEIRTREILAAAAG